MTKTMQLISEYAKMNRYALEPIEHVQMALEYERNADFRETVNNGIIENGYSYLLA